MSPGPSPLLHDWIQIPTVAWLVLGCIVVAVVGIVIVNIVRVWQETGTEMDDAIQHATDDRLAQDVNRYHCAGHGCAWHLAEGDRVYVCGVCGARVVRDADVYDQENGVA